MTIEHTSPDVTTERGEAVAKRLKTSSVPITELQFDDQQAIMQWMTSKLLIALPKSIQTGTPVKKLLAGVAKDSGVALTDLYYGLQYAEEIGVLSVHGDSVTRPDDRH